MTTLDLRQLCDALRAGARGIHPLEAGTGLLIQCGSWLHRQDFTSRFITTGISDGVAPLASIDWETAVTALHTGELPARPIVTRRSGPGHRASSEAWQSVQRVDRFEQICEYGHGFKNRPSHEV